MRIYALCAAALLLSLLLDLLAGPRALAAEPETRLCPELRPLADGGRSAVLGLFLEAGVRCRQAGHWSLTTGLRYTDRRGGVGPFAVLAYARPLTAGWRLYLVASAYERHGDYEIHRLPDLTLRWSPPAAGPPLISTLDLSLGAIEIPRQQTLTGRAGVVLTLAARPVRLDARTTLAPVLWLGSYAYHTGQSHSFWTGAASVAHRLDARTEVSVLYLYQQGFGASPLVYDQVGLDSYVSGRISLALSASDRASFTATIGLIPQAAPREYVIAWTRHRAWTASVTWRQTDAALLFGFTVVD